jgi:hypothetical protein
VIVYLAHPVAPTGAEYNEALAELGRDARHRTQPEAARALCVKRNVDSAYVWFRWVVENAPNWDVTMPWAPYIHSWGDDGGPRRAADLQKMVRIAARHDAIVLCGGRVSEGMAVERNGLIRAGKAYVDLSDLGPTPPAPDVLRHLRDGRRGATHLLYQRMYDACVRTQADA